MPAAAAGAGPLTPGAAAPRSRPHVGDPRLHGLLRAAGRNRRSLACRTGTAVRRRHCRDHPRAGRSTRSPWATPAPVERQASDRAAGNLVAAAKAPVSDATAGLVLGYVPGSIGVPAAAETQLRACRSHAPGADDDVALEGFAAGGGG